jgi:hypothetical protein
MSPNNTFTVPVRLRSDSAFKVETVEGDEVCLAATEQAAEIIVDALNAMMLINRLRDGPGRSVTILCDNDDPAVHGRDRHRGARSGRGREAGS